MRYWIAPSAYFPHRGGVEELSFQLAAELTRRGHEVLVVAPRHPADLPECEVIDGIDIERVTFTAPRLAPRSLLAFPLELVGQLRALRRIWRRQRPDLVHIQCPSVQTLAIALVCLLHRTPLVVTSQGEVKMDANALYERSVFMRSVLRWVSGRARALTACSTWTALAAGEIAPAFKDAEVVLNGVDLSQWQVAPPVVDPVVCAWGRHVPQKGLDLLIEAFKLVRTSLPEATLLLGGSGPETSRLEALAGPGVSFLGSLDRDGVQQMLARSRLAVVPSRLEPFGIVALEAMATGRACVWSTVGGLGEATQGLGWGVDPTDSRAMADAILAGLAQPLDPKSVRRGAEARSWPRIVDEYEAIYHRCTSRNTSEL